MQTKRKSNKISLNKEAAENLAEMLERLTDGESYVKVTPSQLASSIISRYRETGFTRDKQKLKKEFFDHKAHLKSAIIDARDDEELKRLLAKVAKNIPARKTVGNKEDCSGSLGTAPVSDAFNE